MLLGPKNVAALPTPLAAPDAVPPAPPPPASVVTAFVESETARTRLLPPSATYTMPLDELTAIPLGEENNAVEPTALT
jgi:hypothetical protein